MDNRIKVVALLLIIWPIVFFFLYLHPPEFTPSLPDNYTRPNCQDTLRGLSLDLSGCTCPALAINSQGFQLKVTGYGHCGFGENNSAKQLDLAILGIIEASLAGLMGVAVVRRKRRSLK